MKINRILKHQLFEPLLLLGLFYLPGFLQQWQATDFSMMNSLRFQLIYIVTVIPQILLTLYLMKCSPVNSALIPEDSEWKKFYGLKKFSVNSLVAVILLFIAIWIYVTTVSLLLSGRSQGAEQDTRHWIMSSKPALMLFIFTSQFTGWSEELFFRGFLLKRALHKNIQPGWVILVVTIIFASLHFYQGVNGVLITGGIGLILALYYLKTGDLTSVAITHGLYNLSVLFLSFSLG